MAEIRVKSTGTLKLFENDNTSSVTIASPASLGADRTITLPDASVTLASGTMLATDGSGASLTALNASELGSGTVPTARLGSGTASSSTVVYGDQTYKAEPGGGKILQVQHVTIETATTVTAGSFTTTGVTDTITPSATSSKILVMMDVILGNYESAGTGNDAYVSLYRDIGGAGFSSVYRNETNYSAGFDGLGTLTGATGEFSSSFPYNFIYVDEPSTTSACTYTLYMYPAGGSNGNNLNTGPSNIDSAVVLMEIDGS